MSEDKVNCIFQNIDTQENIQSDEQGHFAFSSLSLAGLKAAQITVKIEPKSSGFQCKLMHYPEASELSPHYPLLVKN